MKEVINKEDVRALNHYGKIYSILFIIVIASAVPLFMWLGSKAFIPWGITYGITMIYAFKLEKIKKANDVQTYKEIVAFSDGKKLDEIQKQREIGKRPYQKLVLVVGCAVLTLAACCLIGLLMNIFWN